MTIVRAEIPATVWQVKVQVGDAVADGDELVVLESMKMEIPVVSPRAGTVAVVSVAPDGTRAGGRRPRRARLRRPMSWSSELDELGRRRELADGLGGAGGDRAPAPLGKLTVRERIDRLADPGSFRQFGVAQGRRGLRRRRRAAVRAAGRPGRRAHASIDGRKVVVTAGDFTVRGGSAGGAHGGLGTELSAPRAGARVARPVRAAARLRRRQRALLRGDRSHLPARRQQLDARRRRLLNAVPVVSAVLGSAAGLPALNAVHRPLQRDADATTPRCSPAVRRSSRRRSGTDDHQGGARRRPTSTCTESGVVDNLAEDEDDALAQIRRFLSYLPVSRSTSCRRAASRRRPGRPPRRVAARRRSPATRAAPFDARRHHRRRGRRGLVLRDRARSTAARGSPGSPASTATRSA